MPRTRAISRPPGRKETSRPHRTGGPAGLRARRVSARRIVATDQVVDLRDSAGVSVKARPTHRSSARARRHHSESSMPPAVNGALAGVTVASATLLAVIVVAVLGWVLAADHSSLGSMFNVAAYGWLSIHLVPVQTSAGWLWLPPIALTAAVVWLSFRVGRSAARRGGLPDSATRWRVIGSGVTVYAVIATILAAVSATSVASVPLALAPFAAGAVFGVGFAAAILTSCGRGRQLVGRIPGYLWSEGRAALWGLAVLAGSALVVLLGAMAVSHGEVGIMGRELRPGFSGTLVLALASLVYLPTAVLWAASFLLGPGVALGAEGFVAPWGVAQPDLPFFPLLAAVPDATDWWFYLGFAVPLAAGVVAAIRAPEPVCAGRSGKLASSARVAGLAAAMAGVAALLAHGGIGGRLSDLGPSPLLVAGAVLAWFLLGAGVVAGARWMAAATAGVRGRLASGQLRSSHPAADVDAVPAVSVVPAVAGLVDGDAPAAVPDDAPVVEVEVDSGAAAADEAADDVAAGDDDDDRIAVAALLAAGATVKFGSPVLSADPGLWLDLDVPAYLDDATVVLLDVDAPDLTPADS